MKSPCLLMMVMCSLYLSTASSHIVTSQTKDVPMRVCVQRLANLYDLLCGYDEASDISDAEMLPPSIMQKKQRNSKQEDFFRKCCMRPCSYVEITKLC